MDDSNKKILVVEDDASMRNIIMDEISKKYLVIPAQDGEDALQKISQDRPDLIILDLLIPKVDGFQVLQKLRDLPDPELSKIPVIVVSNLADLESMHKAKQFGIEEYFIKYDIRMGTLTNRIRRVFVQGPIGTTMQE